jgi:hypothetical protein
MMTGLHTGHTPIRGNKEIQPEGQEPLPDETVTFPEVLEEKGYVTGAFGKWGLGFPGSEGDPIKQGFDEFYGYNCQRFAHNYYPYHLWHNDQRVELKENEGTTEGVYAPVLIQENPSSSSKQTRISLFLLRSPRGATCGNVCSRGIHGWFSWKISSRKTLRRCR